MAWAQMIAAGIYILYVALLSVTFTVPEDGLTETAVIDMMAAVAPALPPLLVLAALAAQASAAVADAGGAGGLAAEATGGRVTPRIAYLALAALGLGLTWGADVFEIIAYASRAFAAYYALQSLIALRMALKRGARGRAALYAGMAALGVAAVLFAAPSEGH